MFIIDSSLKLELCGFCLVFVHTPQVYIYESVASQYYSVLAELSGTLLTMCSCSVQVLLSLIVNLAHFRLSSFLAWYQGPRKMEQFFSFTVV